MPLLGGEMALQAKGDTNVYRQCSRIASSSNCISCLRTWIGSVVRSAAAALLVCAPGCCMSQAGFVAVHDASCAISGC